jgi:hypothetical protein
MGLLEHCTVWCNERRGRVVNRPASHSEILGFKSRPGDRLFMVFLCLSRQMLRLYLELTHDHFFHLISNSSFTYKPFIRRFFVSVTEKRR